MTLNGTAWRWSSNGRQDATGAGLETDAAEHERAVIGVLELVLGVDPAGDPDVRAPAGRGDLVRLGDRHRGRRREQPADPEGSAEGAQDEAAGDEGDETRGADQEGSHGPDDRMRTGGRRGGQARGATSAIRRRAWKDPKEPTRGVGVDVIAAVSLRSAPPG